MQIRHLAKVSAAAAIFAALPAIASAQQVAYNVSPVAVSGCSADATSIASGYGLPQYELTNVSASFTNESNVPATHVKLILNDGRGNRTLDERGNFAPGATIDRFVTTGLAIGGTGTPTCSIAQVDFADGSSWAAANQNVATR